MKRTHKGFTLVELLIVIAIIGVLAAMMTLSSSDATISAKAASIASGYKVIGSAFAVYYSVSGDAATADGFNKVSNDYLGSAIKDLGNYTVGGSSQDVFTVQYTGFTEDIKAKFLTYSKDMGMDGGYKMRIF